MAESARREAKVTDVGEVVSEEHQKLARCTIVCVDEADHECALHTWRSVMRAGPKDMPNVIVKPE